MRTWSAFLKSFLFDILKCLPLALMLKYISVLSVDPDFVEIHTLKNKVVQLFNRRTIEPYVKNTVVDQIMGSLKTPKSLWV